MLQGALRRLRSCSRLDHEYLHGLLRLGLCHLPDSNEFLWSIHFRHHPFRLGKRNSHRGGENSRSRLVYRSASETLELLFSHMVFGRENRRSGLVQSWRRGSPRLLPGYRLHRRFRFSISLLEDSNVLRIERSNPNGRMVQIFGKCERSPPENTPPPSFPLADLTFSPGPKIVTFPDNFVLPFRSTTECARWA